MSGQQVSSIAQPRTSSSVPALEPNSKIQDGTHMDQSWPFARGPIRYLVGKKNQSFNSSCVVVVTLIAMWAKTRQIILCGSCYKKD